MQVMKIRTPRFLVATVIFLSGLSLQAALTLEESFVVPAGTAPATGWTGTDNNDSVVSGSLSVAGLEASEGNAWSLSGAVNYSKQFSPSAPLATGATYYYSFLFRMDDLSALNTTGHSSNLIMLSASNTASNGVASFGVVKDADNANAYNFVFDGDFRGPNNSLSVKDPALTEYTVGQTIFVVLAYTRGTTSSAQIWINPDSATFGAGTPPSPYLTDAAASRAVDYLVLNSGTGFGSRPGYTVDEFKVGTTWASVTPALQQGPTNGTLIQISSLWLPDSWSPHKVLGTLFGLGKMPSGVSDKN